jgi:small subunit ribosomal protein S6
MPLYDLMVLLDPGAPSDRQESILRDVQGLLESGGQVVGSYDWGTRRMTFEIDHRPEAAYHLFQFETEPGGALLDRVDHSLKIMDGVLRHRIIRLKDGSPPPPVPRPEGRGAYAADAEGVAGYDADPGPPNVPDEVATPAPAAETAPEAGEPVEAPAIAAAEQPAAPAAAPAETPLPPETAEQEAAPAGGDDDAPSGDAAA